MPSAPFAFKPPSSQCQNLLLGPASWSLLRRPTITIPWMIQILEIWCFSAPVRGWLCNKMAVEQRSFSTMLLMIWARSIATGLRQKKAITKLGVSSERLMRREQKHKPVARLLPVSLASERWGNASMYWWQSKCLCSKALPSPDLVLEWRELFQWRELYRCPRRHAHHSLLLPMDSLERLWLWKQWEQLWSRRSAILLLHAPLGGIRLLRHFQSQNTCPGELHEVHDRAKAVLPVCREAQSTIPGRGFRWKHPSEIPRNTSPSRWCFTMQFRDIW